MYYRKSLDDTFFIYFWFGRNRVVNNNRTSGLFSYEPFIVSEENCNDWRETSKSDMIAPELLTYWDFNNEM